MDIRQCGFSTQISIRSSIKGPSQIGASHPLLQIKDRPERWPTPEFLSLRASIVVSPRVSRQQLLGRKATTQAASTVRPFLHSPDDDLAIKHCPCSHCKCIHCKVRSVWLLIVSCIVNRPLPLLSEALSTSTKDLCHHVRIELDSCGPRGLALLYMAAHETEAQWPCNLSAERKFCSVMALYCASALTSLTGMKPQARRHWRP